MDHSCLVLVSNLMLHVSCLGCRDVDPFRLPSFCDTLVRKRPLQGIEICFETCCWKGRDTSKGRSLTGLLPKPAEVLRLNVGGCLSAATTPESCRNGGWPTQNQNRIDLSPQTAVVFGIPWVGVHGHDAAECCTGRRTEAPPTFRTQASDLGNRPL